MSFKEAFTTDSSAARTNCGFPGMGLKSEYLSTCITSCVLNCVFAPIAVCGNTFVLIAVLKTRSLHTPSNVLFCCLAFSDLIAGLVAQPSGVVYQIAELNGFGDVKCLAGVIYKTSGYAAGGTSFLTVCIIGVERYLAVYLHLRYRSVVTNTRVLAAVTAIWIVVLSLLISRMLIPTNRGIWISGLILAAVSALCTLFTYGKIFKVIRRHQRQIHNQDAAISVASGQNVDINKFKKRGTALAYIVGAFVICYLPMIGAMAASANALTQLINSLRSVAGTVSLLNSSLNPFIYCWRLREIRTAVLHTVRSIYTNETDHRTSASVLQLH